MSEQPDLFAKKYLGASLLTNNCHACSLHETCSGPVDGEGPKDASILLLAEAPGEVENDIGRPLIGDSGTLLRQQLREVGIPPETIWLDNIVHCRPPNNRTPYSDEIKSCLPHIQAVINKHQPKLIILCGATALHAFLPKEKLKSCHGVSIVRGDITYFPIYHPAAGLHSPQNYSYFINDIQALGRFLVQGMAKEQGEKHYIKVSITNRKFVNRLQRKYEGSSVVAFDFETETLDITNPSIVGVSICNKDNVAYFIYGSSSRQDQNNIIRFLKPIVTNPNIIKLAHNLKYETSILLHHGVRVVNGKDTMIAAFLLNNKPGSLGLKSLARRYLGVEPTELEDLMGKGKKSIPIRDIPIKELTNYSCADADNTFQLYHLLYPQVVEQGMVELFDDIECPLVSVLADMEYHGIKVDTAILERLREPWSKRRAELKQQIEGMVDHPFNINSTKQLGEVLFGELGLPVISLTGKKKQPAISDEVMQQLKDRHPIIPLLIEHSDLRTRIRTFIDGLTKAVNPRTGMVHTSFNQTIVPTGRLSSSSPNLQNQPARDEEAKTIRSAFVPREPGWVILKADFKGQELRLLAHFSQDERLLHAYRNGGDVHKDIMIKAGVNKDVAKIINFGIIYGITEYGLSNTLGTDVKTARQFISDYLDLYPGVVRWREQVWEEAEELGYVTTITGQRRWIPEIQSTNPKIREAGRKYAVNTIVQGSGAALTKIAMLQINKQTVAKGLQARLLLQVHDEIDSEVKHNDLMPFARIVRDCMVNAIPLSVPLEVELSWGPSWGETKPLEVPLQ